MCWLLLLLSLSVPLNFMEIRYVFLAFATCRCAHPFTPSPDHAPACCATCVCLEFVWNSFCVFCSNSKPKKSLFPGTHTHLTLNLCALRAFAYPAQSFLCCKKLPYPVEAFDTWKASLSDLAKACRAPLARKISFSLSLLSLRQTGSSCCLRRSPSHAALTSHA